MAGIGGAIEAARAFVRLSLEGRERVEAGLRRLNGKLKAFGAGVAKAAVAFAAIGAAATVPLAASVKAASDMEEVMNKFNVVFGESADSVKEWSDSTAKALGRSKKQMAEFAAESADLLMPLGFAKDDATEMSKALSVLAVDLASFNNKSDKDTFRDLQAALTGSSEVMKKYGVVVNEAAVKQELLNKGLDPKHATDQQKVQARLAIIMRGTTAAQGDAMRSAGSFANQQKRLTANIMDSAAAIGARFLPILSELMAGLNMLFEIFSGGPKDIDAANESIDGTSNAAAIANVTMATLYQTVMLSVGGYKALAAAAKLAETAISKGQNRRQAWLDAQKLQSESEQIFNKFRDGRLAEEFFQKMEKARARVKKNAEETKREMDELFKGLAEGDIKGGPVAPSPDAETKRKLLSSKDMIRTTIGHVVSNTGGRLNDALSMRNDDEAKKHTELLEDIHRELRDRPGMVMR